MIDLIGAPGGIRTPGLMIRSQKLLPFWSRLEPIFNRLQANPIAGKRLKYGQERTNIRTITVRIYQKVSN